MKTKRKLHSVTLVLATLILFLILVSSTASAATTKSSSQTAKYAYVTNSGDTTVSVIDTTTNKITATVDVGYNPYGVAVSPNGKKVYVGSDVNDAVSVIDTATNKVTATVPVGSNPWGVAVNPAGTKVYVANEGSGTVSVIDASTNKVTDTVNVGNYPCGVVVNSAGTKAYVVNTLDNTVSVINTATDTVTATVSVGNTPTGVDISPDGTKVYVTNDLDVSVINTATNTVTATVSVGTGPWGVAVNPAGTKAYVTNYEDGTVSVIDTATNKVTTTISVGSYPLGVAITLDGTKVYVANEESGTVSVINTATNKVISTVTVGKEPVAFGKFIGSVSVQNPVIPVANFAGSPVSGSIPLKVQFTDKSTGSPTSWKWNFGDGSDLVTEYNPTHTYSKAGTYTVKETVSNAAGKDTEIKTNYITVTTPQIPVAAFSASPTSGEAPLSVSFTDKSTNSPTSWKWTFGDGSSSTSQNPTHKYSTAGKYTVTLTATNAVGSNTKTLSNYITVTEASETLAANFVGSPVSGSVPLKVKFTDTSTGSPTSWKWNFGDGSDLVTGYNPTHTYSKSGTYTVKETVNNAAGKDTEIKTNYITVTTPQIPVASFSASPTSGEAPLSVTFTDTSTNSPTSWKWTFGDGSSSTSQNPTHKYSTAGKYTVTLTATNAVGSNTKTLSNYITVTEASETLAANFVGSPVSGSVPLKVKFTDTSTGSPTSWKWNFGDGSDLVTGYNPTHTYSKAGTYTVKETVSNAAGKDTEIKTNYITVTTPQIPVASFSASPTSGEAPLSVSFTDTSTNSPTSWKWTFGDGSSSTSENPTHKYSKAGKYAVTLTATNAAGSNTKTLSNYITVTEASETPAADFVGSPVSGSVPLKVKFTDTSTGSPTSWKWNFGDGSDLVTGYNPTHTYSKAGTYTVKETVSNAAGKDTDIKTDYITVTTAPQIPVASFSATPTSGEAPLSVSFTDKSTNSPTSWKWTFGDGSSSTSKNPTHQYSKAGKYKVTLTATNAAGSNTKTLSNYITVTAASETPAADFWGSPKSGNTPLKVTFTDASTGSPTSWKWDFGDGSSSTSKNPTHTYSKAGSYDVKLTVTNAAGSNFKTKHSYITVTTAVKTPVAAFSASPTSGHAPLSVTFTDKSTNSPTSWKWTFGDGSSSTSKNPTHQYSKAGKYTVTLTATNAAGSNTKTLSNYITVTIASVTPVAAFSAYPTSGHAPLSVTFTDKSTNSPTSWKWTFGDGSSSTSKNPTHQYSKAGKYTVILTATNAAGSNAKTLSNYITVTSASAAPVANFWGSPKSGTAPLKVTFTETSTGSPTSWKWDFGDGSSSTVRSPTHTYSKAGKYTVILTASNAAGSNNMRKYNYVTVS